MRRAAWRFLAVSLALGVAGACNSATRSQAPGDDTINDTHMEEGGSPSPNPTAQDTGSADSTLYVDSSFMPMLNICAACSCSMDKGFCFAGGQHDVMPPDAEPACVMTDGGSDVGVGCNTLPAACAKTPTCDCVVDAIQPQFKCYLNCTPDNGYLLVYCPDKA